MPATLLYFSASTSLIALIFLCVLWEAVLAPIRPGGSLLMLKVLPLLLLFGVLRGRVYSYQWASLLVLAYFCEGVVRSWSERGPSRTLAVAETALAVIFFFSAIFYARLSARHAR